MHLTPSTDIGRMISIIHNIKIAREEINLVNSLKIAQLVLKHRQNRNQQQRIIIFIGSPVVDSLDKLERVCKLMKKNNIGMDIINFGGAGNTAPITRMIEKVDNQGNSHFLNLEAGAFMLSDALISSPILMRGGGAAGLGAGGGLGGLGEGGNVDPNEDPELAMAIRISMEEARADRQDPLPQGDVGGDGEGPLIAPVEGGEVPPPPPPVEEEYINMDDENLQEQLLAHLEEGAKRIDQDVKELHQAESISSYRDAEKTAKEIVKNMDPSQEELKDAFEDKDFISGLLKDLPGIEEGEIAVYINLYMYLEYCCPSWG